MKESGGTDDKDVNPDDVEIDVLDKSDEKYSEPQVYSNNRSSDIGETNSKMKPQSPSGLSPENDMFSGAAASKTTSDDKPVQEFGGNSAEFKKHFYFNTTCVNIRRFINLIGAFAALLNVALDIVYAYRVSFSQKLLYILVCAFLAIRIVFTLGFGQYYY